MEIFPVLNRRYREILSRKDKWSLHKNFIMARLEKIQITTVELEKLKGTCKRREKARERICERIKPTFENRTKMLHDNSRL